MRKTALKKLLSITLALALLGGSTTELRDAGQAVHSCLEEMARRCDDAAAGAQVSVPNCPAMVEGHGRSVAASKPRSVAAWAQLHRPRCQTYWETNP